MQHRIQTSFAYNDSLSPCLHAQDPSVLSLLPNTILLSLLPTLLAHLSLINLSSSLACFSFIFLAFHGYRCGS